MTLGNLDYLNEHGPVTAEELPFNITVSDRANGLHTFKLNGGHGDGAPMGGHTTRIYYLDNHDCEDVVRRFLEVNPELVEQKSRHGLLMQINGHGSKWKDAARAVTREFYNSDGRSEGGNKDDHGECPACGEYVTGELPAHLRNECPINH